MLCLNVGTVVITAAGFYAAGVISLGAWLIYRTRTKSTKP